MWKSWKIVLRTYVLLFVEIVCVNICCLFVPNRDAAHILLLLGTWTALGVTFWWLFVKRRTIKIQISEDAKAEVESWLADIGEPIDLREGESNAEE